MDSKRVANEFRNATKILQNSFRKFRKKMSTAYHGQAVRTHDARASPSKSLTLNANEEALISDRTLKIEKNPYITHVETFSSEAIRGKCEDCSRISVLKLENEISDILGHGKGVTEVFAREGNQRSLDVRCKATYDAFPNSTYKNNTMPRGLVFMLNFEEFEEKNLTREGSEIDYKNLVDLFHKMGYHCDEDSGFCKSGKITKEECLQRFLAFRSAKLHESLDSCIIIIMSHGAGEKAFLSSDGGVIKVKEIYKHINSNNCPQLKGKPKIFIFQFCRMSESDTEELSQADNFLSQRMLISRTAKSRIECLSNSSAFGSSSSLYKRKSRVLSLISTSSSVFTDSGCEDDLGSNCSPRLWNETGSSVSAGTMERFSNASTSFQFPPHPSLSIDSSRVNLAVNEITRPNSDMFMVFSTVEGEVSYRDPKKGSLLIQSICHVFAENACCDNIEELFKKVSRHMTRIFQTDAANFSTISQQQTCERTNIAFDQNFYFNPQPFVERTEKTHPKFY